jgi:hypothetical protein
VCITGHFDGRVGYQDSIVPSPLQTAENGRRFQYVDPGSAPLNTDGMGFVTTSLNVKQK